MSGLLPIADHRSTLATWAVTLGLAATTAWYLAIAVDALRHPLNPGDETGWALLALGLAALVPYAAVRFQRAAPRVLSMGILGLGLVMVVLSGQVKAALITAWLLALAGSLGFAVLGGMGASDSGPRAIAVVVAFALGLTLLALIGLALGLLGVLRPWPIAAVLSALTLVRLRSLSVGWRWVRVTLPARSRAATPDEVALAVGIGYSLLLSLTWALAPEVQFDALNYQLAVPRMYLNEGRVVDLHYMHSYLARLMSMLFALGLALEGPVVAKLLMWSIGVAVVLALYAIGSRAFGRPAGAWAAALFGSTPLVVWLTSTTYVDLAATMFAVTSFLALLAWREYRIPGWLCSGGILLGAAVATKLTTAFLVPGFALVLLAWCLRDGERPGRRALGALLGFGAASLAVAAPWYAITYVFTGNPVFPLLNGVFKSPRWPPVNSVRSLGEFGIGSSPGEILSLPFVVTSQTQRFGEAVAGSIGPTLTLLPLAAFLLVARRPGVGGLAGIAGVSWLAWAYGYQYARYFVPVLPFAIVLVVGTVLQCSPPGWVRRGNLALLGLIVVGQLAIAPLLFWNIPERFPIALAFGREASELFLARALQTYPAARFVNGHIGLGEKVIGVRSQNLRFYLDAPLLDDWSVDLADVLGMPARGDVGRVLAERGYRYLIVDGRHDRDPRVFPDREFLDCCATIAFARPPGKVYRIHSPVDKGAVRPEENLLRNPGLEESTGEGAIVGWHPYGRPGMPGAGVLAHSGRAAIVASASSGLTQPVAVEGGRLYTLSHYSRADEPGQFARLQINWLDAKGALIEASIELVPVGRGWAKSEMTVTAPERAVTAMIYASVHANSRVAFDDFSLTRRP